MDRISSPTPFDKEPTKKEEESNHLKNSLIPPDYMYRFYSPTLFDKEPKKHPEGC